MPKYSRNRTSNNRAASAELIVDPSHNSGNTTGNATTSNSTAERRLRRIRYELRQQRLRSLRQEAIFAQRREVYSSISEQSRGIQQYASEEPGGNDSSFRLNQMVTTAEQLIANIQRVQRLGREAYTETRCSLQERLVISGRDRQELLILHEKVGSSDRTMRLFQRETEEQRRKLEHQIEQLEKSHQEEEEDMESLKEQVRRLIDHYTERERYNAVRSAFLEPSLPDFSKDYRSSTGRILKSTHAVSTEPIQSFASSALKHPSGVCNGESSFDLSAHFGDDDTTPMEHGICVICLYEYQVDDVVVRNAISESHTRCNHLFHEKCVTGWIESSRKAECPCCRQPFVVKT